MLSSRSILCFILGATMLCSTLFVPPAGSDVTVPYEWIVPGAHAEYIQGGPLTLFYPNGTKVIFWEGYSSLLKWTVLDRVGDSARLNLVFVAEGMAMVYVDKSLPDGKIDILDIALVAKAFGKGVYEWGYSPIADVTGLGGEPDQKVNILDISFVALAFGLTSNDPKYNPIVDIAPSDRESEYRRHLHQKTLELDIDIFSRETFFDGKPLGKTCFWAEPYADVGNMIVLYNLPGELVGNVKELDDEWADWLAWTGVTTVYRVQVSQLDPFAWFSARFDWYTGMSIQMFLLGEKPLNPNGTFTFDGIPIKRFAHTPLGTELNIATLEAYKLDLNSTNVQLGPPT